MTEESLGEKERELTEARERITSLTDELVISQGKVDTMCIHYFATEAVVCVCVYDIFLSHFLCVCGEYFLSSFLLPIVHMNVHVHVYIHVDEHAMYIVHCTCVVQRDQAMLEEEKELLEEEKELLEERVRELTVQLEEAQSSKVCVCVYV